MDSKPYTLVIVDEDGRREELETFETVEAAIRDAREMWMEDTSPNPLLVLDPFGLIAAMMERGAEPEICVTSYRDGTVESHRCCYVLDRESHYLRTEITELCGVPAGFAV